MSSTAWCEIIIQARVIISLRTENINIPDSRDKYLLFANSIRKIRMYSIDQKTTR